MTPFALVNDRAGAVEAVLDRDLLRLAPLNFHPLENARTTAISPEGLLAFLQATGHRPTLVDFAALGG